jgi:hypothetical protein
MNYLTNYYKNLSEQLQEQLNRLEYLLNEEVTKTSGYDPLRPLNNPDPFSDASQMTTDNIIAVAKRYGNDTNGFPNYQPAKDTAKEAEELNRNKEYQKELQKIKNDQRKDQEYKKFVNEIDEQINYLANYRDNLILEYRKTKTQRVDIVDVERGYRGEAPLLHGRVVTKKGNPAGKGAAKERNVGFYPGMGSMPNYPGNDEADAEETIYDWGRPSVENNPIYANIVGKGPAQDVLRAEIFDTGRNRKGGSVKGTGKKVQKKEKAIRSAEYDRRYGS